MKNITIFAIATFISALSTNAHSQSFDLPQIPSNAGSFYYEIGGGSVVSRAPTYQNTVRTTLDLDYGFGYSCGKFSGVDDVSTIIEDLVDTAYQGVRELPQHLMRSVTAAISAMPGYLLNKANPSLYNTLMKGYDDSFELFELSYKSCRQMETEIAAGKNPYQNFVTASIAENWSVSAGVNQDNGNPETIDLINERIKSEGGEKGITLFANNKYGGRNQDPIRINFLTTLVGYNVLTGHSPVDDIGHAPAATETVNGVDVSVLIPAIWPTSLSAANWMVDVIGDKSIVTYEDGIASAKAGKGLKTRVLEESFLIREALTLAIDSNDYSGLRVAKYDSMLKISGNLINAIKDADEFERAVMIDRISTELAVKLTVDTVAIAKQLLLSGLHESHLVMSAASEEFESHIRTGSMADLDSAVNDILNDLKLRENTFAKTPQLIIQEAEARIVGDLYRDGTNVTPLYGIDPDGAARKP